MGPRLSPLQPVKEPGVEGDREGGHGLCLALPSFYLLLGEFSFLPSDTVVWMAKVRSLHQNGKPRSGEMGEAVWFALYKVQGEGTRVSDHSAQEGIGLLSDQLHLPPSTPPFPSVGSSQPGGASGREQWPPAERLHLECCRNPCLSSVGQEGIRLPSALSTEGLPHWDRQLRTD